MATPAQREQPSSTAALPGPVETAERPPDIAPARDFGWLVAMISAILLLGLSWTIFGTEADGMWAGYWASFLCTIAIIGAFWMRSTLPKAPGWALAGLSGGGLLLVGIVQGYALDITISLIAGGAGIIAGIAISASGTARD